MKAFVFELVRTFEFDVEPGLVIDRKLGLVCLEFIR